MIIEKRLIKFCRVKGKPGHYEVRAWTDRQTTEHLGFVAKGPGSWRAYTKAGNTVDAVAPRRRDAAASLVRRRFRNA